MIKNVTSISNPLSDRRRISQAFEWSTPAESRRESFRTRFRMFMSEAMLRQAQADLLLHAEQGHRIRAYFASRRVQRLRQETVTTGPETGDRVVAYLKRGARNLGRV